MFFEISFKKNDIEISFMLIYFVFNMECYSILNTKTAS